MSSGYLCNDSTWLSWLPWLVLGFYGLISGIFAIGWMRGVRIRRPRRGGPIPVLLGMVVAVGVVIFARGRSNAFQTIDIKDGKVVLGHFWPHKDVELSSADVERLSIVRGRHFYKGKRRGDIAWFNVRLSSTAYASCESSDIPGIVAQARTVASTLGKPIDWKERCPDTNSNALVMSTEADVTSATTMAVPAACSSAAKK